MTSCSDHPLGNLSDHYPAIGHAPTKIEQYFLHLYLLQVDRTQLGDKLKIINNAALNYSQKEADGFGQTRQRKNC